MTFLDDVDDVDDNVDVVDDIEAQSDILVRAVAFDTNENANVTRRCQVCLLSL